LILDQENMIKDSEIHSGQEPLMVLNNPAFPPGIVLSHLNREGKTPFYFV